MCLCAILSHPPDEWEQSILQSHPATEGTQAALDNHRAELQRIRKALSKLEGPLQQLLAAADVAAQVMAGTGPEAVAAGQQKKQAGHALSEGSIDQAFDLLRQAAAHVKWF